MSALDRLKAKISQDGPDHEATKVSKAPFVPFVAPLPAPFPNIHAANETAPKPIPPEIRLLIDRVMRVRDCPAEDREAFAADWRNDPEGIERGLRHLVDYYGGRQ